MDASTRSEYDLDDLVAAARTFAPDPEEGEAQATPAEQAKGLQGDREHTIIVEINAALDKASQASGGRKREKYRRAAGRKLVEAKKTISPDQWEKWCLDHVKLPFAGVTKLVEAAERIQASNRKFMGEARAAADNISVSDSPAQSDNKDTEPMDFNELIQAGVEEGILASTETPVEEAPAEEAPAVEAPAVEAPEAVEPEQPLSCKPNCEIEIDQNLRHGAACLEQARKAETRVNDLKLSAQYVFKAAKVAWMAQPDRAETWSERCARVIPQASQRTVDALISGKLSEIEAPDVEEYRKALAREYGFPYYTPEERANIDKVFVEARAKETAERLKAAREAKKARANEPSISQTELQGREPTPSKAEVAQAARDRAEAIRVASGGKPAQTRMVGLHKEAFDDWCAFGREVSHSELLAALEAAKKGVERYRKQGWQPA